MVEGRAWSSHTEFSKQGCLDGIGGPFTVDDGVVVFGMYAHDFLALEVKKLVRETPWSDVSGIWTRTLENLSRPPSVSLSFWIHSCVFEKRLFSESWKGDSHGSSLTTPSAGQYV